MSLETSITDLTAASNALTNAVNGKVAAIDAEVQTVKDGYNAAVSAANPAMNMLSDSGRFDGGVGIRGIASGVYVNNFFSTQNGSSFSDGGKFITDNSTYGGLAGALTADVISLLVAVGRNVVSNTRYGVEFYINKVSGGSGVNNAYTDDNGDTRYLLLDNSNKNLFSGARVTSLSMMIKVNSGSIVVVDSVFPAPASVFSGVDGWSRVISQFTNKRGEFNSFPAIYAEPNTEILIALPFLYFGNTQLFNTAPEPSF